MAMLGGEMQKLWEEVKANHRALETCVGPHDFVEAPRVSEGRKWDVKYGCLKCTGVIDRTAYNWYKLGLKHGGRG